MTVMEAKKIVQDYYDLTNPTAEDKFIFTEALEYLISETKDPMYMTQLGSFYYGDRQFDLACKYYEMAAEYDDLGAIVALGYIWYYGRTGTRDYRKAFYYYSKGKERGDLTSAYKLADMYKNGYHVVKDMARYREIIEELYPQVKDARWLNQPLPEVFTRLAAIRAGEGRTDEALDLYDRARWFLAERIQFDPFFGDLNIMKWMIGDIYRLRPFDEDSFSLYDLYYLLREPVKVRFEFEGQAHEVEMTDIDGRPDIRFDDTRYPSVDDFFQKAELDGELLTMRYMELYGFEVMR